MAQLKPMIKNLILVLLYIAISNIVFAKQNNHQCNDDESSYYANSSIDKQHDYYQKLITPENDLITGFLIEIKNHNSEERMNLLKDAYTDYFNSQQIRFKNRKSTADTNIFCLTKDMQDQNFYVNFSKVIFWLMLNRRDSSVAIKPIIGNQEITNNRVIFFDKQLPSCDNPTNDFLDPENIITSGYSIQIECLADQQDSATLLFNCFKDYLREQRLIFSDLNLYTEDFNNTNISYRFKIDFNKVGTQLMHDYGKSLIWLLLNHGDMFLHSSAKFFSVNKDSNSLISFPDASLYSGKKTNFKQEFIDSAAGANSDLLANTTFITDQNSKLKQREVLDFWFDPEMQSSWFKRQHDDMNSLDRLIKEKFSNDLFLLANGCYDSWLENLEGKLAYIIMTDQFPRNIYRGTPMITAYDKLALKIAKSIIEVGDDKKLNHYKRIFCYLPLTHSEDASNQQQSMKLFTDLLKDIPENLVEYFDFLYKRMLAHKIIIDNFGRFLHRDKVLFGIKLTPKEIEFIEKHDATF
jgi:uncharacterized protein (DUF924 family)